MALNGRQSLNGHFNKYAGREVSVTEKPDTFMGQNVIVTKIDDNDSVTAEIRQDARDLFDLGLVKEWLPGAQGDGDVRHDRLNYSILKEADGKYRVQKNSFGIG